jgi:hypothetical protein
MLYGEVSGPNIERLLYVATYEVPRSVWRKMSVSSALKKMRRAGEAERI